ncbi:MAG: DUF1573 domain-containing protein [Planctomycetota bacterium]|nr:DUF1573 domain-containing protein [Planctomycetota bacterium]
MSASPHPRVMTLASIQSFARLIPCLLLLTACGAEAQKPPASTDQGTATAQAPAEPAEQTAQTEVVAPPRPEDLAPVEKPSLDQLRPGEQELKTKEVEAALAAKEKARADAKGLGMAVTGNEDIDPGAKLEYAFGSEKHDFGKVTQGAVLDHTFSLKSAGTSDLIIRQAKPTCGCTVAQMLVENDAGEMVIYNFGDPIPPGRKIELAATLATKNKRNNASSRINIAANEPRKTIQLSLSAFVEPYFNITPTFVNFGEVSDDVELEKTVDFRTAKGQSVLLTLDNSRVRVMPQGLSIGLEAVDPDEHGKATHWRATVNLGPGLKEGTVSYPLKVLSDVAVAEVDDGHGHDKPGAHGAAPGVQTATANISARVRGVITYSPAFVSLGIVRPGLVLSRTVRITSHDPDFELGSPEVSLGPFQNREFTYGEYFSFSSRPVPGQNAIDVELRLDGLPEGSDGNFKAMLKVAVNHPSKESVEVIVSGVCRAGMTSGARTAPAPGVTGVKGVQGVKGVKNAADKKTPVKPK